MEADLGARLRVVYFLVVQYGLVDEVQLAVGGQTGAGEVAAADDAGDGEEPVEQGLLLPATAIEQVTLGVEEAAAPALVGVVAQVERTSVVAARKRISSSTSCVSSFRGRRSTRRG